MLLSTALEPLSDTREFYERIVAEVVRGGPEARRLFQADEIKLWKRIAPQAKVGQQ